MWPILTGPASISSPDFAARVLISFISAHGKVSSIPNRIPILFIVTMPPGGPRRATGILSDPFWTGNRTMGALAGLPGVALVDSHQHEARIRLLAQPSTGPDDGIPLVRRPGPSGPLLPDLDGAVLPERGRRRNGSAGRQGRRRMAPADLRGLGRRRELVQHQNPSARPGPSP